LSQHGKAAWHEKDREKKVSLTETAVNHRIEEWRRPNLTLSCSAEGKEGSIQLLKKFPFTMASEGSALLRKITAN
jgi:hypothetical protein